MPRPRQRATVRAMRLTLSLLLAVPGLLLLATPWLPLGLLMVWGGWWVYERSRIRDGDGLAAVVMVLGGLGALVIALQAAWQAIARLL